MNEKMKRLAQQAIVLQDACNLSGVLYTWGSDEVRDAIWEDVRAMGGGTTMFNNHPLNILFASKVASLTSCELGLEFSKAYAWAQSILKEPSTEVKADAPPDVARNM